MGCSEVLKHLRFSALVGSVCTSLALAVMCHSPTSTDRHCSFAGDIYHSRSRCAHECQSVE